MDRLTSMGVFVKAADLGSFAAAAAALGMSPQMVSKHVMVLENRLGATLLNRTTRRQSLTDVGRAYYERCRAVLAEAEAADMLLQELRNKPQGILRVSAPVTFGSTRLAPFVLRYMERYPDMRIDLSLTDRFIDPLQADMEVMIRIGGPEDHGMITHLLADYRVIVCASPDYLDRHGKPETPQDLVDHCCLLFGTATGPMAACFQFASQDGANVEVEYRARLRSDNWLVLLEAARAGFGIVMGSAMILEREIEQGRLVRILERWEGPRKPMRILYPASRRPTAKIRSFIEATVKEFGPETP